MVVNERCRVVDTGMGSEVPMLGSICFPWVVRGQRGRRTVAVEEWRKFGTASWD